MMRLSVQGVDHPVSCVLAVNMQEIVPVDYWHQAYSSSLGGGQLYSCTSNIYYFNNNNIFIIIIISSSSSIIS